MTIGTLTHWAVSLLRKQDGILVVEAFAALLLITVLCVPLLAGIATMHHSNVRFEIRATAENITRNQMVDIFATPYQEPPYTYIPTSTPEAYSVSAEALAMGVPGLATIRVAVSHSGEEVVSLETLRTNR